jgi:hypothetical protein
VNALSASLRLALPGLWAGLLLCVALVATPAAFAVLPSAEAGKVVGYIFGHEAPTSLALGMLLFILEQVAAATRAQAGHGSRVSGAMLLVLGALFCTVVGYYALQPMMAIARSGQGHWSFGQLHAVSLGLFGVKMLLVLGLTWRAARRQVN